MSTASTRSSIDTEMPNGLKLIVCIALMAGNLAFAEAPGPGRALYVSAGGYGCGVCHGPVANGAGQAGGAIRGATREALVKALKEQPTMQLLVNVLSEQDISNLASYLGSLSARPLVEMVFGDRGWAITHEPVSSGQNVQLVVFNDNFSALEIDLSTFGLAPTTISALDTTVLDWVAEAGTYVLPDNTVLVVPDSAICVHQ